MYSGMAYGNGNGHHNSNQNTQNHQASEHFLQNSTASTFLQELIDCNRKRVPVVTGSSAGNTIRGNPPPPAPQSGTDSQHGPNSGAPGGQQQQQQHPMSDANANLNNEQWNFMGPKMAQWGDKHSAVGGSAAPVGGQNGNQQLEDDFRLVLKSYSAFFILFYFFKYKNAYKILPRMVKPKPNLKK